jgi:hypothetical protein
MIAISVHIIRLLITLTQKQPSGYAINDITILIFITIHIEDMTKEKKRKWKRCIQWF